VRVRLALALLAAAVAAAAGIALEVGSSSGWNLRGTVEQKSFDSKALDGQLRFAVYLPPGYSDRRRYPVIYFLHGLPAAGDAFRAFGFVPSALEQSGLRAIVVAPQGARDGDSDPEYLDWGPGRNWETAIAEELPAYVDAHYRTIRGRAGRALIGLSAGGYGAFLLTLHHLPSFAVVESWSGYFHPTDPSGTKALRLGSAQADARASAHELVSDVRAAVHHYPTLLAFYVGTGDTRFRAENVRLDRELAQAKIVHVFRLYAGEGLGSD
jgi:S-formylglutathione hydrolase FrmB